ncbi:MAG: hypothetical protein A3J38_02245 [Gammaproteobacteria bacterium RIFCSPHIGHO2_12_FULL_45_9]|nr:MAG: hypothetical protein A3J38_02245 [Gammaproteobacteria bacterium RIFCSPHIGHO2_12_FULL_45_9]
MKIVADKDIPFVEKYFAGLGELVLKSGRLIKHADVSTADILLVRSITKVNKELLSNTTVKWVGSVTTGHDHLDVAWLEQQGIGWSVAAGFNAVPVVEYVICVVAALQQRMGILTGADLTAGVIGVGAIGQQVADKLKILGFNVLLCDPLRAENESNFCSVNIEELVNLDFITMHTPLTRDGPYPTYHLIEKDFLQRQKSHVVLLNTGRGSVINSVALKKYGQHLRWCFDVWEHEPQIDKAILMDAVLATPHIAGYSVQARYRGVDMIYQAACQAGVIAEKQRTLITWPEQELAFSDATLTWQEVILAIYDPSLTSYAMKNLLLSSEHSGDMFDQMRKGFMDRYEFSSTRVGGVSLRERDKAILTALGCLLAC